MFYALSVNFLSQRKTEELSILTEFSDTVSNVFQWMVFFLEYKEKRKKEKILIASGITHLELPSSR